MKQIKVIKNDDAIIVKLPADRNGFLNPSYQTGQKFLGEILDENWGVPDATLEYRFTDITPDEYEYIYDDIYIVMRQVYLKYYDRFKQYMNNNINIDKKRMKRFMYIINNSLLLEEARKRLRNYDMHQYLSILDLFVQQFEEDENL